MNILLLIAAIAACLAGLFIKSTGNTADFQAQSAKFTSALSCVFLGRRALKKQIFIPLKEFDNLLIMLYQYAVQARQEIYHYGDVL